MSKESLSAQKMLEVAKLGRTVGLKGALRLHNLSDFLTQFKKGAVFYDNKGRKFTIKSFDSSASLVVFEGFESLESAKELVNTTLLRSIEETRKFCKLKKGEFFYFDIIGLEVFENGQRLGVVEDILENGAGVLLFLRTDEALLADYVKEFFIPYNDHFIVSVDLDSKKIISQNALAILENS